MLYVSNTQRQNVAKAAKLISHTNAMALKYYHDKEDIGDSSCEGVIEFLELFNEWFELMNSTDMFTGYRGTEKEKEFFRKGQ